MSIEQKIAEILAEAKIHGKEGGSNSTTQNAGAGDQSPVRQGDAVKAQGENQNPDNKRNDVKDEKEAEDAPTGTMNPKNGDQSPVHKGSNSVKGVKEDMDALFNGEELTEQFKEKATTIFESAVMVRVNEEVARIESEFEAKLEEAVAQNTEGLVEKVDGYLGYIAEQWMEQNEIALERGIKSEILESFVAGLKTVFEEHYIEVPEEKFDVLADMEDKVAALEAKLNEQVEANVELSKTIAEAKRAEIVKSISEGLTDTETEKFLGLVEELSYEDAETFETKVKTIRENYFTQKQNTIVESVVTDTPVETLTEEKKTQVDPAMAAYLSALNKI
jgi:hypothetical protein